MREAQRGSFGVMWQRIQTSIRYSLLGLFAPAVIIGAGNVSLLADDSIVRSSASLDPYLSISAESEETILAGVNRFRVEKGLNVLKLNKAVRDAALKQSVTMAQFGYLAHEDAAGRGLRERLSKKKKEALHFRTAGENVARNRGFSKPAAEAIGGWINSPGHLANMLNAEFSETGIGVVVNREGTFYFTQIFLSK